MAPGRRGTTDGFIRWLLPASVLHAVLILLAAAGSRGVAATAERAAPPTGSAKPPESSVELTLLDDGGALARSAFAPSARFETVSRASGQRRAAQAVDGVPPAAPRVSSSQPALTARSERANGVDTPPAPVDEAPLAGAVESEPQHAASPALSLDQLGIGTNPFMGVAIEPLSKLEQAQARLHAALHPLDVDRDRQRGLGPEGPIVAAARNLVLADEILVETSAVLNVRVDASGRVTEVQLLEASSQSRAWQLIAARLAKALTPALLRRAESKQGWDMKLRVASSVQLPSGVAPGLRMGLLGEQVAGSGGPRSTSLELSPTSKLDLKEPIDSVGRHLDSPLIVDIMLLKLKADLTDIGAPARRVVEVAVLSIDAPAAP